MTDTDYMRMAIAEAKLASAEDEVPVGAILVRNGEVIARAHNTVEREKNASRHAELTVMQEGMARLSDWRLSDCTLYVTLEPCAMCMGAAVNAHLKKLIFGAFDEVRGCCVSATDLSRGLGWDVMCLGGVLEGECAQLLTDYFRSKRK